MKYRKLLKYRDLFRPKMLFDFIKNRGPERFVIFLVNVFKGSVYFVFRSFISSSTFIKLRKILASLYISFLNLYLFLVPFYLLLETYLKESNLYLDSIYSTISRYSSTELLLYKLTIIVFVFVCLKNIVFLYNFFQKYIVNGVSTLIVIGVFVILAGYIQEYPELQIFILGYGYVIVFFVLLYEMKMLDLLNKQGSGRAYYINSFKKIYDKTFPNYKEKIRNKEEFFVHKWNHFKEYYTISQNYNEQGNYIQVLNDDPINIGGDMLGFKDYAKNIYDVLNGIDTKSLKGAFSIGVVGEWGSGKSSVINLLYGEYLEGRPNFIYYEFNPWSYDREHITEKFLTDLGKKIGCESVSKDIGNYLGLLGLAGGSYKLLSQALSFFFNEETLDDVKERINKTLGELNKKVVVVIDDLDRCEPGEVIQMLNIIKNIGNFKNIVYVISYDRMHIISILKSKGFDETYIEKIVNIEAHISKPQEKQLYNYFLRTFEEILKDLKLVFASSEIRKIIDKMPFLYQYENLRFLKKLLNQINIRLQLVNSKNKGAIEDLDEEDLYNLVLINYVKLKDYSYYNTSLGISLSGKNRIQYSVKDYPLVTHTLSEEVKNNFLEFCGISKTSHEGTITIHSKYKNNLHLGFLKSDLKKEINSANIATMEKQIADEQRKLDDINRNVNFLKDFS